MEQDGPQDNGYGRVADISMTADRRSITGIGIITDISSLRAE